MKRVVVNTRVKATAANLGGTFPRWPRYEVFNMLTGSLTQIPDQPMTWLQMCSGPFAEVQAEPQMGFK